MSDMSKWLSLHEKLEELLNSDDCTQEEIEELQCEILGYSEDIYNNINMR